MMARVPRRTVRVVVDRTTVGSLADPNQLATLWVSAHWTWRGHGRAYWLVSHHAHLAQSDQRHCT
jgi:hypothetical protein